MTTGEIHRSLDLAKTQQEFIRAIDAILKPQFSATGMTPDLEGKLRYEMASYYRKCVSDTRVKEIFRWVDAIESARPKPVYKSTAKPAPRLVTKDDPNYAKTLGNYVCARVYRGHKFDSVRYSDKRATDIVNFIEQNFTLKNFPCSGPFWVRNEFVPVEQTLEEFFGELDDQGLRIY